MKAASTKDRVYEYIVSHSNEAPSVREMCSALGIRSTSTVFRAVHALEEEGKIRLKNGVRRNVFLATDSFEVKVPVLDTFDADLPVLAQDSIATFVTFNTDNKDDVELFAFRTEGDDLKEEGILNGDLIIAGRTEDAGEGELAVIISESRPVAKRFNAETDRPVLLGKVVASYRYYR